MKTGFYLLASAMLICLGCSGDDTEQVLPLPNAGTGRRTLTIRLTGDAPESRTTIIYPDGDQNSKLVWSAGDRVSCFLAADGANFSGASTAEVGPGGVVTLDRVPDDTFTVRVRYPAVEEGAPWSEPDILPDQRQSVADRFDGSNLPLMAEGVVERGVETVDLPYRTYGSVIRIRLTAPGRKTESVRRITLSGSGADGDLAAGSGAMTLTLDTPADLSAERLCYCVVRHGTYELAMNVETDAATYYYRGTFGKRTFGPGLYRFALALDNGQKSLRTVAADSGGKANCYLLKTPGGYSFDAATAGNGRTSAGTPAAALIDGDAAEYGAACLWTTGEELTAVVSGVRYDAQRKRICFEVPDPVTPGSAVVALYNISDKRIVWTWHLWVNATVADNRIGSYVWMNQNLGATSASGSDELASYGLYYQFGRKDPEIGANAIGSVAGETEATAFSDRTAASKVNTALFGSMGWAYVEGGATLAGSVLNPMQHRMQTLATGGNSAFTDVVDLKTLWGAGTKTLYDPCPPGYKVPTATQLTAIVTALKNGTETTNPTTNARGYTLSAGNVVWLPMPGYRLPQGAGITQLGRVTHIWGTGDSANAQAGYTLRCTAPGGSWSRAAMTTLASGASVRCIREE